MDSIDREDERCRRVIHYQVDEETGAISASAFMKKRKLDQEVSVFLVRLCEPSQILDRGLPGQRLIVLKAQDAYDIGLDVVPQPIDKLPGHCVITGFGQNWKEQCLRLAEASRRFEPTRS